MLQRKATSLSTSVFEFAFRLRDYARSLVLSAPRMTIVSASSGRGRCNAFFIPGRAHPSRSSFVGSQHCLGMDWRHDGVRLGREKPVDQMRAGDGLDLPLKLRTWREQNPRIFRALPLSSALSCSQLPNEHSSKNAKSPDFTGLLMVGAQGIEPWTSPV
jgi:hypothetical protein